MTDRPATGRPARRGALWAAVAWTLGVLALLVALPLAARDRLPEQVATHWSGRNPDGSMPLTAAALFPAGIWLLVALGVAAAFRFRPGQARGHFAAVLAATGVLLTGAQTSVVHANLDRARWQDAAPMGIEVVLVIVAAGAAGLLAWFATRTPATGGTGGTENATAHPATALEVPADTRLVWLSHAANAWMQVTAAVLGLGAAGIALIAASGLSGPNWFTAVTLAVGAVVLLLSSSVQVRVTAAGLYVGFGPFGWPARRFAPEDLLSARAEQRTAGQTGGWGYRINNRGTTVMLRGGDCLVVRTRRGSDFAVSVDDAERGAALLNTLITGAATPTR
ncbi:DUF1648 domain-containing protein [Kitasatospora sp. SUK 42]|uniref:DUF1648 domain-containing protein n=1 Tax=Kitasatospora sp. SUK 42 TaxID=1588882 RepID=UPI0018C9631D|nr:DUF1648 domain-containing protein [Kitasatospora sp. SUK 42]MBV2154962.1 DUF1648 domain-containing protein [Kitasatospora sp. SUK 42]